MKPSLLAVTPLELRLLIFPAAPSTPNVRLVFNRGGGTSTLHWAAYLWLTFALAAQGATFSTALDRNAIRVGERVVLTLRFDGGLPSSVPRLPDVQSLQIQFGDQKQQVAVVNGQRTVSLLLNYTVTATKPGSFTIPIFHVPVAGSMLPSQPVELKVHPAEANLTDLSVSHGEGQTQQSLLEVTEKAEKGDAAFQAKLGELYRMGKGGAEKNYVESFNWYLKAAQQGHGGAQIDVGDAYWAGIGVQKNLPEAYAWFNLAAISDVRAAAKRDALEIQNPTIAIEGQSRTKALRHQIESKLPITQPATTPSQNQRPSESHLKGGDFGDAFDFGGVRGHAERREKDPLNDVLKKAIAAGIFVGVGLLVRHFFFARK